MPEAIADFYTDLADPRLKVTYCGIPPTFLDQYIAALAFGYSRSVILHTMVKLIPLLPNRNWAMARTPKFENPLFLV